MLKKLKSLVIILIIFSTNTIIIADESSKKQLFVQPFDISKEKAAERARQTVRMLDDMYNKTFIILITKEYVKDPTMFSALILSKQVFKVMSKKGWHEYRLLCTDDHLHNPDNIPKDDFDRDATEALVSGKNYYDEVIKVDGKYYLRAVTSMPAVMEGCIICHPGKKVGDLLGAISYRISLNEYFQ